MSQERRFFVDSRLLKGLTVPLSASDSHHALHVLRLELGAKIVVVERQDAPDGQPGRAFHAEIAAGNQISPNDVVMATVGDEYASPGSMQIWAHLLIAIPKSDLPEWITEKATELGAATVTFFEGDRSVVKLKSPAETLKKQKRLAAVAEAAAKQSKRSSIPRVIVTESLESALFGLPAECELFSCSLDQDARALRAVTKPNKEHYALVIGPEGDLSAAESALLAVHNAQKISLGALTLRVETATICALAQTTLLWHSEV